MALQGSLDRVTHDRISGWAYDPDRAGEPVSLLITVDDQIVRRVLANLFRDDLRAAGIGDGRHAFDISIGKLPLHSVHIVAVCREDDHAHLPGSPLVTTPDGEFDEAFRDYCAKVLRGGHDTAARRARLLFLLEQAEAVMRQEAADRARPEERLVLRQMRWRSTGQEEHAFVPEQLRPRALVVDESLPAQNRDAGSNAILSHMASLRRIGFDVVFAAADMAHDESGLLAAGGITHCHAPWFGAVEEVLRRDANSFDLVYLHRVGIAARYLPLVRQHQPKARIVYAISDLHHLRIARQAKVEDRPELLALARQYQAAELRSAAAADAVITHSSHEAALLRQALQGLNLHVIPWAVPPAPSLVPWNRRRGIAFVAHYGHAANVDAAQWLIEEIVPRLQARRNPIPLLLAGTAMPHVLRRSVPGVEVLGPIASLSELFDRVRLTIAPTTFGAGIQGKLLDSLAAGVPCIGTKLAMEGLDLPAPLGAQAADDSAALAELAATVNRNLRLWHDLRQAGLAWIATQCAEERIDALLRNIAGPAVRAPADRNTPPTPSCRPAGPVSDASR